MCVGLVGLELCPAADVCKTRHQLHGTSNNQTNVKGIERVLPSWRCKQWWRSKNAHVVVGRRKRESVRWIGGVGARMPMLEVARTIDGARWIQGAGVIAGRDEIKRDMLAGPGAKPGREDFAGAKMSAAALPVAISVMSWSSVGMCVVI
jgi:hypothetical protein